MKAPSARTDRFDVHALLETARLLTASLDLDFVLGGLLLTAMSKLLVARGAVLLDDPLAGGFRVAALKGRVPRGAPALAEGDVLALTVRDGSAEGETLPAPLAERGFALALPVVYHGRRIGLVALGPKATGQPFSTDERAFVDALVHLGATAIHNAQAVEELRLANRDLGHKVQQLNTLFDLAQAFNATPDEERAARQLALTLMGHLLVRRFAFLLRANDGERPLEVAAAQDAPNLDEPTRQRLGALRHLLLLDEDAPAEWQPLREAGFALAVPVRAQNTTRAALLLGPKATGAPYDADDVDFLAALGQLALTAIESARGLRARLENERLEEELRLARSIQERLLPHTLPALPGNTLAALALPSRYVAGDYYDAIDLGEGRVLLAVADVAGKGLPASLLMANLQACLHVLAESLARGTLDLPAATARVNRVIHRNTGLTTFITLFWGIYDAPSGRLHYVNAGHNPPLLRRADGACEHLERGGLLLGVLPETPYEAGTAQLEPGDRLVLYTDGVTETRPSDESEEEFGEARLAEAAAQGADAAAAVAGIRAAVRAFAGDRPLEDDLTLLVLARSEGPTAGLEA